MNPLLSTRARGSIARSVLLPLTLLGPLAILVGGYVLYLSLLRSLQDDARNHTGIILSGCVLTVQTVDEDEELQRFVSGFAIHPEIDLILVVNHSTDVVRAASRMEDVGKQADSILDASLARALEAQHRSALESPQFSESGDHVVGVAHAYLATVATKNQAVAEKAGILVRFNLRAGMARAQRQALGLSLGFTAAWLLIIAGIALQLERRVIVPAARIRDSLLQREAGAGATRVEAGVGGELGLLADTVNSALDARDTAAGRLQKAQAEITENESRLREAEEIARLGSWSMEFATHEVVWSPLVYPMLDLSPGDDTATLAAYRQLLHADDLHRPGDVTLPAGEDSAVSRPIRIRLRDNSIRYLQKRSRIETDEQGKPVRLVGTLQDVTDQVRSLLALQASEERYRTLFTTTPLGIVLHGADGAITHCNPAAERILGLSSGQILGLTPLHPAWRCIREDGSPFPGQEHPASMALATGKTITNVIMGLHVPGLPRTRWIRVSAVPAHSDAIDLSGRWKRVGATEFSPADAHPDRVFVTFEDVTEQQESQERVRSLAIQVEQAPFAILHTGVDRRITWANAAFERLTGYTLSEALGKSPGQLLQGRDTDTDTVERLRRGLDSGLDVRVEILNYHKGGRAYWNELTISALKDRQGKHIGYVGFSHDISERVRALDELEAARDRLSRMNLELEQRVIERTREVARQAAALEASLEGISLYQEGQLIYANHSQMRMFGLSTEDYGRARWSELYSPESMERLARAFEHEAAASVMGEVVATPRVGLPFPAEVDVAQLPDRIQLVVTRNITDRVRASNQLRESKLFLETVLNAFPTAVFWKDRQSVYLGSNTIFAAGAGLAPEQLVGKTDWEMPWATTEAAKYRADDAAVIHSATPRIGIIEEILRADGSRIWVETNKVPLTDSAGRIIGILGTFQDVSARMGAQRKLEEREARYRALMEGAGDAILIASPAGKVLEVNEKALQFLGYSAEELMRMHTYELHPPEARAVVAEAFAQMSTTGSVAQRDLPMLRKDGTIVYVDVTGQLIQLGDGAVMQGIFRDSSARRETELRLRELSKQLELSLESGHIGCWAYDVQARTLTWDSRMFELYGKNPETFSGKYDEWSGSLAPEDRERAERELSDALATGETFDTQFAILCSNGARKAIQAKAIFIRDDAGRINRVVGINYDITRMVERERTLDQANRQLAEATRQKDEFLAGMSHELRTPLNSILGMSEALLLGVYGALDDNQIKSVSRIEESGRHLLSLINDILDLAKIEAGKLTVSPEIVTVSELGTSALRFFEETAQKKRITLSCTFDPRAPEVEADPRRLRQILLNLLSNAIKFTEPGGRVTLETRYDPKRSLLSFRVADTGEGIPEEKLDLLFRPFTQLESTLIRRHGGTGLGLSIVKRLAELHHGEATVESVVGKGSVFSVHLPCQPRESKVATQDSAGADAAPGAPRAFAAASTRALLIVEDNEANIQLLRDFLEVAGYEIHVARNGAEGVRMATEKLPPYDAILMDVQMPEMDGLEATRRIRTQPHCARLPIIALTSFAMPGDRDRCLAAGMTEYMSKPVSLRALGQLLKSLLQKRPDEKTNT